MRLVGAGNVGIGTTAASMLFQVAAGAPTSGPVPAANSSLFNQDVQIDGVVYLPAAYNRSAPGTGKKLAIYSDGSLYAY
jgi:hypothetical protein